MEAKYSKKEKPTWSDKKIEKLHNEKDSTTIDSILALTNNIDL